MAFSFSVYPALPLEFFVLSHSISWVRKWNSPRVAHTDAKERARRNYVSSEQGKTRILRDKTLNLIIDHVCDVFRTQEEVPVDTHKCLLERTCQVKSLFGIFDAIRLEFLWITFLFLLHLYEIRCVILYGMMLFHLILMFASQRIRVFLESAVLLNVAFLCECSESPRETWRSR